MIGAQESSVSQLVLAAGEHTPSEGVSYLVMALYIVSFSLFIYGLMGLTGPKTAVRGNWIAATGMGLAVAATCSTSTTRVRSARTVIRPSGCRRSTGS